VSEIVDQLVFGYRDGHELLASSTEVDPQLEARLLPHADARFEDDSEHYLVGVQIEAIERFFLARIWPAPELPRPGAVWTHALLIDGETLASADLLALAGQLRRPSENDLSSYGVPLPVLEQAPAPVQAPELLLSALSWQAFGEPRDKSVLVWGDPAESELSLLAVWRSLPGTARQGFSFRTRGRARTGLSPYSVQVATTFAGRSESSEVRLLDPRASESPSWARLIAEAVRDPRTPLAAALGRFAASTHDSVTLAELWPIVSRGDVDGVAKSMAKLCPRPAAMGELKRSLFGGGAAGSQLWAASEIERVVTVLETGESVFDLAHLARPERLQFDWNEERRVMNELLDGRERLPPESAVLLVDSAARELTVKELAMRASDAPLVDAVLADRPGVFEDPRFWSELNPSSGSQLLDRVAGGLSPDRLLEALVEAEDWDLLNRAAGGQFEMAALAKRLARNDPEGLGPYEIVFAGHGQQLADSLGQTKKVTPEALLLAAATLSPEEANAISLRRWLAAARLAHDRSDYVAQITAARLLARALASSGETARKHLIENFGPVHRAMEAGRLDETAWHILDRLLPDRSSTDRAKRLRKALIKNMESNEWTPKELQRALAPAGPNAKRLVKLVGKKSSLRRIVEGAVEELVSPMRS
jgi:hypothetical protein